MRQSQNGGQYITPALPVGYRFQVYLYGGDILSVRVQQQDEDLRWANTLWAQAAAPRSARGVRTAMVELASQVAEYRSNLAPLLGEYVGGDPIG